MSPISKQSTYILLYDGKSPSNQGGLLQSWLSVDWLRPLWSLFLTLLEQFVHGGGVHSSSFALVVQSPSQGWCYQDQAFADPLLFVVFLDVPRRDNDDFHLTLFPFLSGEIYWNFLRPWNLVRSLSDLLSPDILSQQYQKLRLRCPEHLPIIFVIYLAKCQSEQN